MFWWFMRWFHLTENRLLLILAVGVGIGTGASIWLFQQLIDLFNNLFMIKVRNLDFLDWVGSWDLLVSLSLAGLVVGILVQIFVGDERHHGVAGIMESVALAGGRLRYQKNPAKSLAAAISLGAGASVGPEDPSVQIGANLGSFFGQYLELSEERIQLLVAAGAASAIASAFNAPIAGVFFALEVILGNFATRSVGVVVLAAVMSSAFTQSVGHAQPELGIQRYALGGPLQIPFYIALGLVVAPVSVLFIRLIYWQRDIWHQWHLLRPIKTMIAGILVGCVGVFRPEILGIGREFMNEVLNSDNANLTIQLLLLLVILKMLMTSISVAGEFMGGIFAPSLFVGSALGGAYGRLIDRIFPSLNIGDPPAYAIAGMAAAMAGIVHAPITAILLIFELTNDYQMILPIMLTTVITVFLMERMDEPGIYHKALQRVGVNIQPGQDVDVMQSVLVKEVMRSPAPTIGLDSTLLELRDAFRQHRTKVLCVVQHDAAYDELLGIVSLSDLQEVYDKSRDTASFDIRVGDIYTREVITVTPDQAVFVAIKLMGQHGFAALPVVDASNDHKLIGFLSRNDVLRSYNMAISRKWESQYRHQLIRLSNLVDELVLVLRVAPGSPADGKSIQDIYLPTESVIVSIRRGKKVIIPRGSTRIEANDELTIVTEPDHETALQAMFTSPIQVETEENP
jgi:CIC family chloride channel protein